MTHPIHSQASLPSGDVIEARDEEFHEHHSTAGPSELPLCIPSVDAPEDAAELAIFNAAHDADSKRFLRLIKRASPEVSQRLLTTRWDHLAGECFLNWHVTNVLRINLGGYGPRGGNTLKRSAAKSLDMAYALLSIGARLHDDCEPEQKESASLICHYFWGEDWSRGPLANEVELLIERLVGEGQVDIQCVSVRLLPIQAAIRAANARALSILLRHGARGAGILANTEFADVLEFVAAVEDESEHEDMPPDLLEERKMEMTALLSSALMAERILAAEPSSSAPTSSSVIEELSPVPGMRRRRSGV